MIGDSYRDFVRKMSTKSDGSTMPLYVAALGLAGEAAELYDSEDEGLLEAGDVLFYVTAVAEALGISDAVLSAKDWRSAYVAPYTSLVGAAGLICESIKKALWHGQPLALSEGRNALYLAVLCRALEDVADYPLPDIQAANVAKLTARHPKGFNP